MKYRAAFVHSISTSKPLVTLSQLEPWIDPLSVRVPIVELKSQYRAHQAELDAAIREVLEASWFILGRQGEAFESEFAAYCGARHAVGVGSGTEALHLALLLAGVRPGQEVLVQSLTFTATANAVRYAGARPVFVDSDEATWNMDPELVADALEARAAAGRLPSAVVVVDLFGQCADFTPILAACRRFVKF